MGAQQRMASRKDQLEAFNFARRRMVANIVRPSSIGSDEAAPRPVKNFVPSMVVGVLVLAIFAVLGFTNRESSSSWTKGLAIDDSGGRYVVLNGQAHPVLNLTSAKLLLGSSMKVYNGVSNSQLDSLGKPIGAPVGIPGAPERLPSASNLNLRQWAMCSQPSDITNPSSNPKTILEVGYGAPSSINNSDAIVVSAGSNPFVVWNGTAYPVNNSQSSTILNGLFNTPGEQGASVNQNWVAALPTGTELTLPTVANAGQSAPSGAPEGLDAVGKYGYLETNGGGRNYYIETDAGTVQVTSVVYGLYQAEAGSSNPPVQLNSGTFGSARLINQGGGPVHGYSADGGHTFLGASDWPAGTMTLDNPGQDNTATETLCATFSGKYNGSTPVYAISASPNLPQPLANGAGVTPSASTVTAALADEVYVKAGGGVIAEPATGTPFHSLVTDSGLQYPLEDETSGQQQYSAQTQLGYDGVRVFKVPAALLDLIQSGPSLGALEAGASQNQAGS